MRTQKVVLLDRYEAAAIAAAQRSINIAFPVDGPDSGAADDPRRTVLRGFFKNELLTSHKLLAAYETLEILLATITAQCERAYWLAHIGGAAYENLDHGQRTMIDTLVDARNIQRREVHIAHALVMEAWNQIANQEQSFDDLLDTLADRADEAEGSHQAAADAPEDEAGATL